MSKKGKIKTLIIEDSGLMRIMISDALRSDPEIEIIGTAMNGKEGAEKVKMLKPDVVVTDMVMPKYDGLYAVRQIMNEHPTPIILLTSLSFENTTVFEALNAGAIDFVDKPVVERASQSDQAYSVLREKIKLVRNDHSLNVISKDSNNHDHTFGGTLNFGIIVLGASTGGPSTLETILMKLPGNMTIPIVIAQHMPERFINSFASRLNELLPMEVKVAEENESVRPGIIYLAPGNQNIEIVKSAGVVRFKTSSQTFKEFNHPSINCLFISAASVYGANCLGVVLTGMGRDGTEGIKEIKSKGGLTIAQDADSCIVNGMPQSAVETGVIDHIVKLKDMSGFLVSCL